jgi:hypothetical protein
MPRLTPGERVNDDNSPHSGNATWGLADMTTLTVHVGDLHVGSTLALCPPTVRLDDGGTYMPPPEMLWFWQCWCEFWANTAELKQKLGCYVLAEFGGDLREGDHHNTTQLWAKNEHDQDRAVYQVLSVARPAIDGAVFLKGTPAHDGPVASADERYAETLAGKGWPVIKNGDLFSHWIWTAEIEGVRIQAKHAPGTVSRIPTKVDSGAGREAEYLWTEYHRAGERPPDVAIFHHVHVRARGFFESLYCHFCPAWQLPTAWVNGKVHSPKLDPPGGLRLLLRDGTWTPYELRFRPRSRIAWTK